MLELVVLSLDSLVEVRHREGAGRPVLGIAKEGCRGLWRDRGGTPPRFLDVAFAVLVGVPLRSAVVVCRAPLPQGSDQSGNRHLGYGDAVRDVNDEFVECPRWAVGRSRKVVDVSLCSTRLRAEHSNASIVRQQLTAYRATPRPALIRQSLAPSQSLRSAIEELTTFSTSGGATTCRSAWVTSPTRGGVRARSSVMQFGAVT